MWEHVGTHRAAWSMAAWLGILGVAQVWRLPLAGIASAVRRRRRVRVPPVSRAWLREYEAEQAKRERD